jgi:Iap family predicted aminopeptidase
MQKVIFIFLVVLFGMAYPNQESYFPNTASETLNSNHNIDTSKSISNRIVEKFKKERKNNRRNLKNAGKYYNLSKLFIAYSDGRHNDYIKRLH